ncbi:acyl-CoA-binding protein isoform X2 [Juglans microcarpa x Juglans regia]|uniref:acyl-CoA-binding protein isoform X2 n=1 Tax=Juglans microcarpa x Juglans regia TaxID=2249226 RepID=UPI001B7F6FA8|nr:acyl-CoA-binding protein isoform X2 [Juglans microcarpa x Juglans regia]
MHPPAHATLRAHATYVSFSLLSRISQSKADQSSQSRRESNMGLKEEFEEHAEKAKTLPESTTNENKLILYGLYKQATVGAVNTSRPGMFSLRERAKWDAWKAVEGKSKEEAMSDYITKVKQLHEEAAASA